LESGGSGGPAPIVVTRIKADLRCAAVAAASVIAKVERDSIMVDRAGEHPDYGWDENKGYAVPEHISALARLGPCRQHRCSWSLPGVGVDLGMDAGMDAAMLAGLEAGLEAGVDVGLGEYLAVTDLSPVAESQVSGTPGDAPRPAGHSGALLGHDGGQ